MYVCFAICSENSMQMFRTQYSMFTTCVAENSLQIISIVVVVLVLLVVGQLVVVSISSIPLAYDCSCMPCIMHAASMIATS